MNKGIETIIYPVNNLGQAKEQYSLLLETKPYVDSPYYVGYRIGNLEIGLDPNGFKHGMTGPVAYYTVSDIRESLQILIRGGAQKVQDIRDVGGVKLIATVKDPDGNPIGLIQMPG